MSAPARVDWHVARVVRRTPETGSAVRLVLDVPTWPGNDPGAHLDIRLTAPDGYQASRSYSIASSGPGTEVVLAVDEVPDGEVSPYLVHDLVEGDELEVHGPLGRFFVWHPDESDRSPVQLIAGGSGIVPLYAMAAARESVPDGAPFRLLCSVRTPSDLFFADELGALTATRVDVVHTRAVAPGSTEMPGRLRIDSLAELTAAPSAAPRIYVCGPTPFVEAVTGWLLELGHPPAKIRTERFGGS